MEGFFCGFVTRATYVQFFFFYYLFRFFTVLQDCMVLYNLCFPIFSTIELCNKERRSRVL